MHTIQLNMNIRGLKWSIYVNIIVNWILMVFFFIKMQRISRQTYLQSDSREIIHILGQFLVKKWMWRCCGFECYSYRNTFYCCKLSLCFISFKQSINHLFGLISLVMLLTNSCRFTCIKNCTNIYMNNFYYHHLKYVVHLLNQPV